MTRVPKKGDWWCCCCVYDLEQLTEDDPGYGRSWLTLEDALVDLLDRDNFTLCPEEWLDDVEIAKKRFPNADWPYIYSRISPPVQPLP